jgi:ribosomal protein L16 Arg81 hydroxylase
MISQQQRSLVGLDLPLTSTISKELVQRQWEKFDKRFLTFMARSKTLSFIIPHILNILIDKFREYLIANGEDKEYKKVYGRKTLRVFKPHCSFLD